MPPNNLSKAAAPLDASLKLVEPLALLCAVDAVLQHMHITHKGTQKKGGFQNLWPQVWSAIYYPYSRHCLRATKDMPHAEMTLIDSQKVLRIGTGVTKAHLSMTVNKNIKLSGLSPAVPTFMDAMLDIVRHWRGEMTTRAKPVTEIGIVLRSRKTDELLQMKTVATSPVASPKQSSPEQPMLASHL